MGYFANGLVFTQAPNFAAIHGANPGCYARGYRHNRLPVWLLDFWKPRGTILRRQGPFCDPAVARFRVDIATLDAATCSLFATLERLSAPLERSELAPEIAYIHLALAAADAGRGDAFVFAADDNDLDLGCRAQPGTVVSFGARIDWLTIRYADGAVTVTPRNLFLPEHEDRFVAQLATLDGIPGISVLPPLPDVEGQTLYEQPVEQWPQAAGDPAEVLGIGTWDPLMNLDDDFAAVYDQPALS